MTKITGNARFRDLVAARLVLAVRPDQTVVDATTPDPTSVPNPGDYSLEVDTHNVILQAHAFDPSNLVGPWRASEVFMVGDIVLETNPSEHSLVLECAAVTASAQTGASEPDYSTEPGGTTIDNDVTWKTLGTVAELSPMTQFFYQAMLLAAVAPDSGSPSGGTALTITGSGFEPGASVTVGGVAAANVSVVSGTEITCETQQAPAGLSDIVVSNQGATATLVDAFTFVAPSMQATGGDESVITDGGTNYRVHVFTGDGTFEVQTAGQAEYLIVGGAGAGGGNNVGAGGGAGELVSGSVELSAGSYPLVIGAGGVGQTGNTRGESGSDTTALGFTAIGGGGGGGGGWTDPTIKQGLDGGSGGGGGGGSPALAPADVEGGESIAADGVGHAGGSGYRTSNTNSRSGGGGGGAGGPGDSSSGQGGDGGLPLSSSITGVAKEYAAGGGGANNGNNSGTGGGAVGGDGGYAPTNGVANTGSGGGGLNEGSPNNAGSGAAGIVVIRYETSEEPPPWSPAAANSLFWVDGKDSATLELDGSGNLERWDDKSGANRDAEQATSSRRPSIVGDGAEFDGASEFLTADAVAPILESKSQWVVIYVYRVSSYTGNGYEWSLHDNGNNVLLVNSHKIYDGSNKEFRSSAAVPNDETHILAFTYNAGDIQAYVDGVAEGGVIASNGVSGANQFSLGQEWDGSTPSDFFDGRFNEFVILDSLSDREKAEGYLAHKWGLEADLPAGHPYKNAPP